jgi:hypothetical protein
MVWNDVVRTSHPPLPHFRLEKRRWPGYTYAMADAPPPGKPSSAPSSGAPQSDWPKATLWMVVFGIIGLNIAFFIHSCRSLPGDALDRTGRVIQKAGQALSDVATAFKQGGKVKMEFMSYATSISNHQHFQFATLKQSELVTRTEEPSTAFGYVPLPGIVVEARAPVEYTYYLDLNERWDFVLQDGVIRVFAPAIRFNKPAIDASGLTYEVKKGYLKSAEAQENLKRSLTSMVILRARENVGLVRENGRRQTAEFVKRWMTQSFTDGKRYPVEVYFPDEPPPGTPPVDLPRK